MRGSCSGTVQNPCNFALIFALASLAHLIGFTDITHQMFATLPSKRPRSNGNCRCGVILILDNELDTRASAASEVACSSWSGTLRIRAERSGEGGFSGFGGLPRHNSRLFPLPRPSETHLQHLQNAVDAGHIVGRVNVKRHPQHGKGGDYGCTQRGKSRN